ncbi:MAG: glycosyl transferase [Methylophilaceae bacterium 17-44-8]|jgi:4-amino-4-deoxy-L-arabinose transferase-like glycosyltransferase|nr:MAG: glycosyl transferase [Methylophilales bacterium 28-44-11]OZA05506.1 MAG: glycosyl transferase [Methylophilaceae bacterium 17-44-8]
MRFDLDHDWQGNMATPRARVGERAKTHLLIILCAIWLLFGLIGHSPWKPFESQSISVVKYILEGGSWLTPMAISHTYLENPPLYYLVAAAFSNLLSPLLSVHDAARLSSGIWMLLTLLMVGMTGRELWDKGIGRQTTFVFIGCLGLVISAHTMMPAVSALTGLATAFYALALAKRRPYRASALLGVGLGIGFLSTGLLPALIVVGTCLSLPLLFAYWRSRQFLVVTLLALLVASPFLLAWPILSWLYAPDMLIGWWGNSLSKFNQSLHLYFLRTLLWYAWPALPLALWGLWRFKAQLLLKPRFQLMLVFFVVAFVLIGFAAESKEVFALPLLIPLTAMAGGSIETLKRGAAGALNWFGLILFGILSGLTWLGWTAMMTGSPAKIKERLVYLSGLKQLDFHFAAFMVASVVTLIWLLAIFRSQHSNRSTATNWAIGMTCIWTLLMTLWLPMIESARGYQTVFTELKHAIPANFACMNSVQLGEPQRDLLHYFADIKTHPLETEQQLNCDLYLIQDNRGRQTVMPGSDWKLLWQGRRLSERSEKFRLFQRVE